MFGRLICAIFGHKWTPKPDYSERRTVDGRHMKGSYKQEFHSCPRCGIIQRFSTAPSSGHIEVTTKQWEAMVAAEKAARDSRATA